MICQDQVMNSRTWMDNHIRSCAFCTLSMHDHPAPYTVPLCFGYEGDTIFLHGRNAGKKLALLKADPRVSFLFVRCGELETAPLPCDWGMEYASVMGTGHAVLLSTLEKKRAGLERIMARYSERSFHFPEKMLADTAVIAVTIQELSGKVSS